jgi:hypothetical protein
MATTTRKNVDRGFGRSSRMYDLPDGSSLPSVTTVLSAINKPALINWAAKVEREAIMKAAGELWQDIPWPDSKSVRPKMSVMAYVATLAERVGTEKANVRLKNKAGDIGSEIHALAEWTLRKELGQVVGARPDASDPGEWGFMAWEDWRKTVNMVPILVEQTCWSTKCGYAGTFDLLAEMDLPLEAGGGRGRVLTDWKSGKAIYAESRLQIAAYVEALLEMGHAERPLHGLIVRMPKVVDDPKFETRFIEQREITELFKVFQNVLALWRWLEKVGSL